MTVFNELLALGILLANLDKKPKKLNLNKKAPIQFSNTCINFQYLQTILITFH